RMNHTGVCGTGRRCAASRNGASTDGELIAPGRYRGGPRSTPKGHPVEYSDPDFGFSAMTQQHPELESEQAYVDHAYECLESTRTAAWRLGDLNEASMGGTMQARFERNAFDEQLVKRLNGLDLGDAALVFGRIDRLVESPGGPERSDGLRGPERSDG